MENTFYERLVKEKQELDNRKEKLEKFLNSDGFNEIVSIQQSLLKIQYSIMDSYSCVLQERIVLLNV